MATIFVHATAEIAPGAKIGDGTRIWQHCIVLDGAVLGKSVKLGHNVLVENGVRIGNRVTVKDNVSLYDGVTLEDDVFIGPGAIFTNVRNPRAFVNRKQEFSPTVVHLGATIGAGAVIICGVTIGEYALVGAGSVVIRDVPAHALVAGNPAHHIGWVSRAGHRLGPDLICPESRERYRESAEGLVIYER